MVIIDRDLECRDIEFPERQQPPPSDKKGVKRKNCCHVSTIISHIGSPLSAFFATERYMNFSQSEHINSNDDSISSKAFDVHYKSSNGQFGNPLISEKEQILELKRKLLDESDDENSIRSSSPSKPVGFVSVSTSAAAAAGGTVPNCKTRMRWSQELHDQFVQCVNRLGGTNKATPKGILKLMEWEGLTIFHVKSHLQKYRNTKDISESGGEGKHDTKSSTYNGLPIDDNTGMQIKETLQLQLDAQRRLHDQLEMQRKLQLSIEEQGRQLKKMIDQQQETKNLLETQNSNIRPSPT